MIKGILFDKDGTLIEFNSLWIDSTYEFLKNITEIYNQESKLEELAFKVGLEGKTVREDSALAGKTSADLARIISNTLAVDFDWILKELNDFYYRKIKENPEKIKPVCDLTELFAQLKSSGLKIGIVTADNYDVTQYILEVLQLLEYVDFIATADLYERKPNVEALQVFCNQYDIELDEVIHVGDTSIDMEFSKHCLYGVGVLTGIGSASLLSTYTPYVLNNVAELVNQDGKVTFPA
ncbi:HAD family hydrolase [Sporosarcina sp. FSL K6-2383]|uniref:HAD family hydrolase n=1 Tax=Sporosarcina sp. FSL K6-2383 TaxID=2921556 RepID=UPI00315A50AE